MSPRLRLIASIGIVYGVVLAVPVVVVALLAAGLPDGDAATLARIVEQRTPVLLFFGLLLLLACAGIARWLVRTRTGAIHELVEHMRLLRHAEARPRLALPAGPLAALVAEINALADAYQALHREGESRAALARAGLEEERNRLAALMSELAQGVLVCNAEGSILLYNEQARALFSPADAPVPHPQALIGLGRSVFGLLDREQVAHAELKLQRSLDRGERLPGARFIATVPGGRLIRVHAAPYVDASARLAGMVFAMEDVTRVMERETQRRSLLQVIALRIRAPAANVRAAAENLASYPEIDAQRRSQFVGIIAAESQALAATIDAALREYSDALKAALVLEDLRAVDLLELVRQRVASVLGLHAAVDSADEGLWIRADSYALVQAFLHLAGQLKAEGHVRSLALHARPADRFVQIDIAWDTDGVPVDALPEWEAQAMDAGAGGLPLTVRDVLEQHGGEIWQHVDDARGACFRMLVPRGEPDTALLRADSIAPSRPEFYDFDLFAGAVSAGVPNDVPLASLSCTVFDTETTGLEPSAGDEIISIGAVRVVNGRLLQSEIYEQLVNPLRPLNPASARVHRIDAAALAGQPTIAQVLPAFHRFCEDTVLVGHNAAFDMRFLELKEASSGVRFTQPVLDTLLLSALAHPGLDDHRLEAIAERLGVSLIGRHTALGDALLTGHVFLRLLPLLAERGIRTLGEALAASRETYYARLQY